MKNKSVPLVGGFYADDTKSWSAQDCVNWLPTQAEKEGTRTPSMLKTPPGLREFVLNKLVLSGHLPSALPYVAVNYAYVTKGGAAPLIFTIDSGALPTGLSMDSHGVVTGMRTVISTSNWVVRCTDSMGEYATLPDIDVPTVTYGIWDNMTLPVNGSLDAGNIILSASAATIGSVFGTGPISGKSYFEMQVATIAAGNTAEAGLACSDFDRRTIRVGLSASTGLGVQCRNGAVFSNGASVGALDAGSLGASMRLRFAVDGVARRIWVGAIGQAGWVGGGDPVAGTSPTYTMPGTGRIWPAAAITSAGATVQLVNNPSLFNGTIPAGFNGGLFDIIDIGGFATLDPQATNSLNTLSNGNLTATNTGGALYYEWTASTRVKRQGKPYWEITAKSGVNTQDRCTWGICTEGGDYLRYFTVQALNRGYGLGSSGSKFVGTTITALTAGINTGDIIRQRMDLAAGTYEVAINSGSWMTIATGITGPGWRVVMAAYYGTYYPEGGTFNFGASAFAYPVPTGFDSGWLADGT